MDASTTKRNVYIAGISFAVLTGVLIAFEQFWALAIPFVIAILGLAIFSLDRLLILIVFFAPLSLNLKYKSLSSGLFLPTEPLLFGVMLLVILKVIYDGGFDRKVLKHPITIALGINLIWMFFTSITSELPVVSFKFLVSRLWFVIPFYFLATQLFKNPARIKDYIWAYALSFTIVILYTIVNHSMHGFDEKSGHWVMYPFFNDHTSYGALLAMFIPVMGGFWLNKKSTLNTRFLAGSLFTLFLVAVVLSYSRAAWVSLVGAVVLWMLLLLKVKFRSMMLIILVLVGVFFSAKDQILMNLAENNQDSSEELTEHVQSISNISTDASNVERINRWSSAIKMFNERPVMGWGPGTYQFVYAPFQHSKNLTIISTNSGDMGNAHSEYIGPLAEMGFPGMLSVLILFLLIIYTGVKVYYQVKDKEVKIIVLIMLMGLFTYFTHGFLNNFLDTDKASAAVWGFAAVIVAIDIYHKNNKEQEKLKEAA